MSILYLTGDAAKDPTSGFIVHCCNNQNRWGAGFTGVLDAHFGYRPRIKYEQSLMRLGHVSFCEVTPSLAVANVVGQDGIQQQHSMDLPPVRYEALRRGFQMVVDYAYRLQAQHQNPQHPQIHMPRVGCGLAGGDWALVERIIEATFVRSNCIVNVYTLPDGAYFDSRETT